MLTGQKRSTLPAARWSLSRGKRRKERMEKGRSGRKEWSEVILREQDQGEKGRKKEE